MSESQNNERELGCVASDGVCGVSEPPGRFAPNTAPFVDVDDPINGAKTEIDRRLDKVFDEHPYVCEIDAVGACIVANDFESNEISVKFHPVELGERAAEEREADELTE